MKLRSIIESYEGLEDADEFSGGWTEVCSFCGNTYDVDDETDYACAGCGRTTCPDCEITSQRLPDGTYDERIFCSPQCRATLMRLEEAKGKTPGPIIRRIQWSPAAIWIQFPSGETWEYVVYENRWLEDILRRNRRNGGRVVAALKKLGVEARKAS